MSAIAQIAQSRIYPAINTGTDNTLAGKVDAAVGEVGRAYAAKTAAFACDGAGTTFVLPEPAKSLIGAVLYTSTGTVDAIASQVSVTLGSDAKTVTMGSAPASGKKIQVFYVN